MKIKRLILALLFSLEVTVLIDVVSAMYFERMHLKQFVAIFIIIAILSYLIVKFPLKQLLIILNILFVIVSLLYLFFTYSAQYEKVDSGKTALFSNHNVMLFCPHEDDELNELGGIIEEYIEYSSTIRVVFFTNGDYYGNAETRINEAIDALTFYGLPEENIIFLGYPDGGRYTFDRTHLYNLDDGEEFSPFLDNPDVTYGTSTHPPYKKGNTFTRNNVISDITSVILEYRPDIIFCNDYDNHPDHKALSLFLDEAICDIEKNNNDYHPIVMKTFAYMLAYAAENDFYSINAKSTKNPYSSDYMEETNIFNWNDRIRLPVSETSLSKSLYSSSLYKALRKHESQGWYQAPNIISGDRVYWMRSTESVLLKSTVSSGAEKLIDYKLVDSKDIHYDELPLDGVLTEDHVSFVLNDKIPIYSVVLYDSPSLTDNVLDAKITFDDGEEIHTGSLKVNGSPTEIVVNKKSVKAIDIDILKTEGNASGLSEVEAYSEKQENDLFKYIKLQNEDGDFVYTYVINDTGVEDFELYSEGIDIRLDDCVLENAEIVDNKIRVTCKKGEKKTVTIKTKDGNYSDTVIITNPITSFYELGQDTESRFRLLTQTSTYTIYKILFAVVKMKVPIQQALSAA